MLSIGKLASGQADYYLNLAAARVVRDLSVASGVEDYYTGGAEPPGRWRGRLAREAGLEGAVDAAALRSLLDEPDASDMDAPPPKKVPGYDLTFSAPKDDRSALESARLKRPCNPLAAGPCLPATHSSHHVSLRTSSLSSPRSEGKSKAVRTGRAASRAWDLLSRRTRWMRTSAWSPGVPIPRSSSKSAGGHEAR